MYLVGYIPKFISELKIKVAKGLGMYRFNVIKIIDELFRINFPSIQ